MSENFKIKWYRITGGMVLVIEYLNEKGRTLLFEMFKAFDRFNKNWRYSLYDGNFHKNIIDSSLDDAFALFDEGCGNDHYRIEPLKNTVGLSIDTLGNPDTENWHPILKRLFEILETDVESYKKTFEEMKTSLKTDIDKFNADRRGNTGLMVAAFNQNIETVKDLIAAGANVNEQNVAGETALFNTSVPITELLIKAGADVNIQDQYGWTALMNVLQKIQDDDDLLTYENQIRILVDAGADVHKLQDHDGRTAYELCEHDNCKELLKVLAPLPPDMKRFVASGMNYKDIRSLCLVNKEWNRTVCNNQDFYRALLDRGDVFQHRHRPNPHYHEFRFSYPGKTLIGYENNNFLFKEYAFYNINKTDWLDKNAVIKIAKMPGSNNTITIKNEEYIFYYFMWAPRNFKYTNYSKKYTDEEIIDDLRNDETFRNYFCGRSYGLDLEAKIGRSPFGLSMRRLQILLFNKGIACINLPLYGFRNGMLAAGAETVKNADGILNLIDNENIQVPDGFISLYDVFNVDHPHYQRFSAKVIASLIASILRPCTLEDLALEYYRGPSFALTVEMQSLPNLEDKRNKYAELLKKYNVIANFKALVLRLKKGETKKIIDIRNSLGYMGQQMQIMEWCTYEDNVGPSRFNTKHRHHPFRYSNQLWPEGFGFKF